MMMLAISNIAWPGPENDDVYRLMRAYGFKGLEISPARISGNGHDATATDAAGFRSYCTSRGIEVVAMQSLLFGREDLKIFEDDGTRETTLDYLKKRIDLGRSLGARALVFGSPKNRVMPAHDRERSLNIAMDFFHEVGTYSYKKGLAFCIEPNPEKYGTNFLCNTRDAVEFVKAVDSEGLKINADTGTMIMNREDYRGLLNGWLPHIAHFHISEPFLCPINARRRIHRDISDMLKKEHYSGAVSIEMKNIPGDGNVENIRKALAYVDRLYKDRW